MKNLKFDLEGKGLRTLLKPYQIYCMEYVIENGKAVSRQVYEHVSATDDRKSRASVIFFLNDMVADGHLSTTDETGKGGYHPVYHSKYSNMVEFIRELRMRVIAHANQELREGV